MLQRHSARTLLLDVNCGAVVLAVLLGLMAAGYSCPSRAERVRFHIPEGPAAVTLRRFAAQSDMNVLFQSNEVSTQRTRAVSGRRKPLAALELMLAGSGLEFRFQEPDSVLVRAKEGELLSSEGACEQPEPGTCEDGPLKRSPAVVTVRGLSFDPPYKTGQIPVGVPDVSLTREEFERGGFQTVGEVLRSMPQNFGGGFNLGVLFAGGSQNTTPESAASTMNLRGLGSDSTLVLVNGQRLAASEASGAVDVTLIPISAVERIEITTSSASALFGSDAVAGVVNIIIRTDFRGVELSSALGYATSGGGVLQHYSAVGGHALPIANVFAVLDCAQQHEIDAQQRIYIPTQIAGTTLMPRTRGCSEMLSASRSVLSDLEMSVLGAFTRRSALQAVGLVAAPGVVTSGSGLADVDQYAVNAVLRQRFLRTWTATLSGGLSADNIRRAGLFSQTGMPDVHGSALFDNRLWTAQLVTSGTVATLRSGAVRVAIGAGQNQQYFRLDSFPGGHPNVEKERRVRFALAESFIPLIAGRSGAVDSTKLSLLVAGRAEHYGDVGDAKTSKLTLSYKPISTVKLQASWGTSFHVPTLLQQFNSQQALLEFVPDMTQASGESLTLVRFGSNDLLRAERSTDREVDLIIAPESKPGMSLRIGYFNIDYHQRIGIPTINSENPLADPSSWPFVIRNPSPGYIREALAQSQLTDLTLGQRPAQDATVVVDDRTQNFVRQKASGLDVVGKFGFDSALGQWDTSLNVAYLKLQQQITNETDLVPLSGTVYYPPRWRGRFGVSWNYEPFLASVFVNYTGGSREESVPGLPPVPDQGIASWTTLDSQIGISLEGDGHWGRTRLTLSAQNLMNRWPPLIIGMPDGVAGVNYDSTNSSPIGRFLTLQLTQTW